MISSAPIDRGLMVRHLFNVDPSRLGEEVANLDISTLHKLLGRLTECQRIILESIEESSAISCSTTTNSSQAEQSPRSPSENHTPLQQPPIFHVEVLHQVCLSQFLRVEEMGRLLLLVSKSFVPALGQDRTWEILCRRKWRNTPTIASNDQQRGYEWLFRQRIQVSIKVSRSLQVIATPSFSPNDLTMLISIFNTKQKEVVSLALTGKPLRKLLDNGELNVSLHHDHHVALGSFPVTEEGVIEFEFDRFCTDFVNWTATLHLLRTSSDHDKHNRLQCVGVHQTSECSWGEYDYCVDPTMQVEEAPVVTSQNVDLGHLMTTIGKPTGEVKPPPPVEVDMGYLEFSSGTKGLDLSMVGKSYEERIRQHDGIYPDDDRLEAIKMEPTLLCFTRNYQESSSKSSSVELVFSELRLDVWKTYRSGTAMLFHSGSESKKHGVTLLHLLDHLAGWEDE
jgi:hypothetical protein